MKIKKQRRIYQDNYVRSLEKASTRMRDITNRTNGFYEFETRLDYMQCAAIYQTNAVARNAVDNIVKYFFKNGLSISIPENPKFQKRVMDLWEEGGYKETIKEAMINGLVSGHALVYLLDKNQNPNKPLQLRSLKGKKRLELVQVDGRFLTTTPDLNILSKNYQKPIMYFAVGQPLHPSWCGVFNAIIPPDYLKASYKYMGMSYYEAAFQTIINDEIMSRALPNLVYRSSIVNYKLSGFSDAVKNGTEDEVLRYVEVSENYKSYLNATVCDAQDSVEVVSRELSGLSDLDQRSIYRLSAGFKQPATILLGKSPDGMNATGQKDMESFYNFIEEWQEHWMPQIKWVFKLLLAMETGRSDIKFDLKFNKVNMVDPGAQATTDSQILDNAAKMREIGFPEESVTRYLMEKGLLTEEEVAYMTELRNEIEAEEEEDPLEEENRPLENKIKKKSVISPSGEVRPYANAT